MLLAVLQGDAQGNPRSHRHYLPRHHRPGHPRHLQAELRAYLTLFWRLLESFVIALADRTDQNPTRTLTRVNLSLVLG